MVYTYSVSKVKQSRLMVEMLISNSYSNSVKKSLIILIFLLMQSLLSWKKIEREAKDYTYLKKKNDYIDSWRIKQ